MNYRARNHLERDVLETFEDKLEESDEIESEVKTIICETLSETTLSQPSEAEDLAEQLIEEARNVSE